MQKGDFGDQRVFDVLVRDLFGPLGCVRYGVRLQTCATYDELAGLFLGFSENRSGLHVEHDGAGAPLLVDANGVESSVLISLTDEDGVRGIAWAQPGEGSDVVGVGIDLAVRGDFPFTEKVMRGYRRIFTEREWEMIHALAPDDLDLGATLLFSAKEAAFKSASQRIRATFQEYGANPDAYPCPYFELRDIETVPYDQLPELPGDVVCMKSESATEPTKLVEGRWASHGISCIGNAAEAFDFLGIDQVETRFALVGSMVLCTAVALRPKRA